MSITHARDMLPPVRELIPEYRLEVSADDVEPTYQRDAKTGVLLVVGETTPGHTLRFEPVLNEDGTPHLVERYETASEDGTRVLVHEGSMVAQDTACHDCGASLVVGNIRDHDFYHLICGRIQDRDYSRIRAPQRDPDTGQVTRTHVVLDPEEMGKPYENSVLECGRAGL